jgi:hypothetical protein
MAFSVGELENIANSALDFYVKGDAMAQTIQNKPLLNLLTKRQQTFPGGKGFIDLPIVFDYTTSIVGYTHNQAVSYQNPANTKRIKFPWAELHAGLSVTFTELKHDGISVTDSATGESTSKHSNRDITVLTNILKAKMDDMAEGWARGFNEMLWLDGTQSANIFAGISKYIRPNAAITGGADLNATGITGGIDRALQPAWRNRAAKFTYAAGQTNIIDGLRSEVRQLTRFGGKPGTIVCGSGFLQKLEAEIHSKGLYTQSGFSKGFDIQIGTISLQGIGEFMYDPTLDSATVPGYAAGETTRTNYAYIIDNDAMQLYVMEGEDKKIHNPARPENVYAIYKSMTWTGGTVAKRLNSSGIYVAV